MSEGASRGSKLRKIKEMSEKLNCAEKDEEKITFGKKVFALLVVGWLFFPFGLAFIALCRWLWPIAFPQ